MAHAGYSTQVCISGTSTAFTDAETEPVPGDTTGKLWRITDATKRVLDPAAPIEVKDGGVALSEGTDFYTPYLFLHGIVVLDSSGGPLTVSGSFLPQLPVAEAKGTSIAVTSDKLDTSTYGTVAKTAALGMTSAEVTLDTLALLTDDFDPGGGTLTLQALQDNDTPKVLRVKLPGGRYWAAWCRFPGLNMDAAADGLVLSKVTASSIHTTSANGTVVSFGFEPIGS